MCGGIFVIFRVNAESVSDYRIAAADGVAYQIIADRNGQGSSLSPMPRQEVLHKLLIIALRVSRQRARYGVGTKRRSARMRHYIHL